MLVQCWAMDIVKKAVLDITEKAEKTEKEKMYSKWNRLPKGQASTNIVPGCLVLEGGAFRGLYTQGILDFWMQHGLNFQTAIGVSAGALALVSYMSGQIGRSARANLGYRHDSTYIGVDAIRKSHSLINLDFLLHDFNSIEPLDLNRFNDDRRRFVAVATNCETGRAEYFERSNCSNIFLGIKASASMPYISPMVDVDGKKCLDGGCFDAIPYAWAMEQGFEKIVVVKTHERGFRVAAAKEQTRARRVYRRHQEFARVLDLGDVRYNEEYDEMDKLAAQGRIFLIEPSEPVTVSRVEGDMEKLGQLYWLGYNDAQRGFHDLLVYLGAEELEKNVANVRDAKSGQVEMSMCEGHDTARNNSISDAQAISDIYRYYVNNTAITFDIDPPDAAFFEEKIASSQKAGYPFLVSVLNGQVVGFAYAGAFKNRAAYNKSVEVSIYVRNDLKGQGIGHNLYTQLESQLKSRGFTNLYACIATTDNNKDEHLDKASVVFHSGFGYKTVGHFTKCAFKFDTWYSMVWMEKILIEH